MKLKLILFTLFLSLLFVSCSSEKNPITGTIVAENTAYTVDSPSTDIPAENGTEYSKPATKATSRTKAQKNLTGNPDDINAAIESSDMVEYSTEDYYTDWAAKDPVYINLDKVSNIYSGTGYRVAGNSITLNTAGIYVISGQLKNGQLIVDLTTGGMVQIVLNGLQLNNTGNAPVYIKKADKAVISLEDGTKNTITQEKASTDSSDKLERSAIYSNADLSINGAGSLDILAEGSNGILCLGTLKITGGNINIHSLMNGITGFDLLASNGGTINIKTTGNGMISTNKAEGSKGFIVLDGGSYTINAGAAGMKASNTLLITGGDYTINSSNLVNKKLSCGLLAASNVTINGGTLRVTSTGDAIASKSSITVNDGKLLLGSQDSAVNATKTVTIAGGIIDISPSLTGITGNMITMLDGSLHITSRGDGIKLNSSPSPNAYLTVSGGYLYVNAAENGINRSGSVFMTGGTVILDGSSYQTNHSENEILNPDVIFTICGGLFIATGSSPSLIPSDNSSQYTIIYRYRKIQPAKQLIHLESLEGNTLLTYAPGQPYDSVMISSPDLEKGKAYTLTDSGTSSGSNTDGLYTGGTYQGGIKRSSFTLSDLILTYLY